MIAAASRKRMSESRISSGRRREARRHFARPSPLSVRSMNSAAMCRDRWRTASLPSGPSTVSAVASASACMQIGIDDRHGRELVRSGLARARIDAMGIAAAVVVEVVAIVARGGDAARPERRLQTSARPFSLRPAVLACSILRRAAASNSAHTATPSASSGDSPRARISLPTSTR